MDYRHLILPRLGIIDPTSAINLNSGREATERRGEADLIGPVGETFLELQTNQDSSNELQFRFWERGNTAGDFGVEPGPPPAPATNEETTVKLFKPGDVLHAQLDGYQGHTFAAGPTFSGGAGLVDEFPAPDGSISHTWESRNFSGPTTLDEIDKVTITDKASGAILRTIENFQPWKLELVAAASEPVHNYIAPFCWFGEFENSNNCATTSENRKIVVRWRKEDQGGGSWKIFLTLGTVRAYASGGVCALWSGSVAHTFQFRDVLGTLQTASITHAWRAADQWHIDHAICGGGAWPSSGGSDFDATFTNFVGSQVTVSWEPSTLVEIQSGLGFGPFSPEVLPYSVA